jgi:hypothetical protein
MAPKTGDCVLQEHSEQHSEQHLAIGQSKDQANLDVMSIRTIQDACMTIKGQVDWSSPSEVWEPGDRENISRVPSPQPMMNTMPL